MEEIVPVVCGIVVGLLTHRLSPAALRAVCVPVLSVAAGVFASWVTGELAVSWLYVLIDVAQALVAGVLTSIAANRWLAQSRHRARG